MRHELKKITSFEEFDWAWRHQCAYIPIATNFIRSRIREALVASVFGKTQLEKDHAWCVKTPKIEVIRLNGSNVIISVRMRKTGYVKYELIGMYMIQIVKIHSEDDDDRYTVSHFELFKLEDNSLSMKTTANKASDLISTIIDDIKSLRCEPMISRCITDDNHDDTIKFMECAFSCHGEVIESIEFIASRGIFYKGRPTLTYFVQLKNGLGCRIKPDVDGMATRWYGSGTSEMQVFIKKSCIMSNPLVSDICLNHITTFPDDDKIIYLGGRDTAYALEFIGELMMSAITSLRITTSMMPVYISPASMPNLSNPRPFTMYGYSSGGICQEYRITGGITWCPNFPAKESLSLNGINSGLSLISSIFRSSSDAVMLNNIGYRINETLSSDWILKRYKNGMRDRFDNIDIGVILKYIGNIDIDSIRKDAEETIKNKYLEGHNDV